MGKTPRLDAYLRLIYRLYEALYLLEIMGRVRGPHHVAKLDFSTLLAVQRRFLKNLAFLCDYKKGGPSSTAVAVEDCENSNVFWLASNEGPSEEIRTFLRSILMKAKASCTMPNDQKHRTEIDLISQCVELASSRIKKLAHGLSSSAKKCQEYLTANMADQRDLGEWLCQFEYSNKRDFTTVCQVAYEARKDTEMSTLSSLSRRVGNGEAIVPVTLAPVFRKVRHTIGRLAAYIRVVKEVLEDCCHLDNLLDVFDVALVSQPACIPRLQADGHTDLNGILKRMSRPQDPRFSRFLGYLHDLDEQTGLEQELQDRFDPRKAPPCVHAEVQMLHHFHDHGRKFFAYDNYIATSKPACFCCKLYFRHHPANYVEPDSHEKVYANWGPIRLAEGRKEKNDPIWIEHRKVMQSVIGDLGKEVLNEIERRQKFPVCYEHPDTLTGLTASSHTLGDDSSDSQDETWPDSDGFSDSDADSSSKGGAGLD